MGIQKMTDENKVKKLTASEEKEVLEILKSIYKHKNITKGINESIKSLRRGTASIIVLAKDVSPPELLYSLIALCEQQSVPYFYLEKKEMLAEVCGINANVSSLAI